VRFVGVVPVVAAAAAAAAAAAEPAEPLSAFCDGRRASCARALGDEEWVASEAERPSAADDEQEAYIEFASSEE